MKSLEADALVTRRDFVRSLVAGAASMKAAAWASPVGAPVVLGLLLPGGHHSQDTESLQRGAELGFEEAQRAAALFNQPFVALHDSYAAGTSSAVSRLRAKGAAAVIGGNPDDVKEIATACARSNIVFLNAVSTVDSMRSSECSSFVFHVEASDAMYESARRMMPSNAQPVEIVLWDPSLTRYGAAQLNDRYHARFGAPMTPRAWAGWMAVKAAWEAGLRAGGGDNCRIASRMSDTTTQFDGHKGAPLSFRTWDHQLRQPLYGRIMNQNRKGEDDVVDIPDIARSSELARVMLDKLGAGPSANACDGAR